MNSTENQGVFQSNTNRPMTNIRIILYVLVYAVVLGLSFYNDQIFLDKLLILGAILSCILFIKMLVK